MTDRYNQDLILGYIEGELDDAEREAFEVTLAEDHELRSLVTQMKLDRERLRSLGRSVAPIGLIDQVIQTQERAELLGDPEAPEPLTMPVNPHRFRRVLMYSGIAAVLLLSAAVVVPTLMPSGLLHHPGPPLARSLTPTDADGESTDLSDSTFAMADGEESVALEDEAVNAAEKDKTTETTVATAADVTESESTKPETLMGSIPPAMAKARDEAETTDSESEEPGHAETELVSAEPSDTTAIEPEQPEADLLAADDLPETTLAAAKQSKDAEAIDTVLVDATETDVTDKAEPVLIADATGSDRADETKTAAINPFLGYSDEDDTARISQNTQILVNTVSPTLASRQIRDWAMSNSVRIEEEPGAESLMSRAGASGGAGGPVTDSQLVIEIKQEQLPEFLAFLNSNPSQQAELVALAQGDNANTRVAAGEDAESDNQPKALANRSVTRSHWPGTTTGLSHAMTSSNTPPAPRAAQSDTDDEADSEETSTGSQSEPVQPFDWSNLLHNITTQPLKPHTPLLQEQPGSRLRMQVLIHQVAEDEVNTRDTTKEKN